MKPSICKILVIRYGSLGDVVLTTPTLRRLRVLFPQATIDFLVKAPYVDLLTNHESGVRPRALGSFNPRGYDLCVDLQGTLRSRITSWRAATRTVRIRNHGWARRKRVWFGDKGPLPPAVVARGLDCLATLPGSQGWLPAEKDLRPNLSPSAASKKWAAENMKGSGPWIAVAPGAAWATKRWGAERFARALEAIGGAATRFVLVGGSGDRAEVDALLATLAPALRKKCLDLAGQTDTGRLAGVLARCKAMICNDSGPMHVASALGVPVTAIFGPTVEAFGFFPRGSDDQVMQVKLSCRPCHPHGSDVCPRGDHACMAGVEVALVAAAVKKTIKK